MKDEDIRLGACGLNCKSCDLYKIPTNKNSQEQHLKMFKNNGWLKQDETLKDLLEKKMYCKGCGHPDVFWSPKCAIVKCCKIDKNLNNCSNCNDFKCDTLVEHAKKDPKYKEGVEYLEKLNE